MPRPFTFGALAACLVATLASAAAQQPVFRGTGDAVDVEVRDPLGFLSSTQDPCLDLTRVLVSPPTCVGFAPASGCTAPDYLTGYDSGTGEVTAYLARIPPPATAGDPAPAVEFTIEATVDAAMEQGAGRVGVLAADGCRRARLYHKAFAARDVEALFLPDDAQLDFMALLYRIKAADVGDDVRRRMAAMALSLNARGAQAVIAACTEVPLVLSPDTLAIPIISSTDALVARAIAFATGR